MNPPLISCLMATHGRYSKVCETLTCFLQQTYPNRELVILNNHPVPLRFVHPLVRILNEPGHPSLGHCRTRLLTLAEGEFIRTWDDDDLYLPWTLMQCYENIGDAAAWKPARSWFLNGNDLPRLCGNAMEASILFRTEAVRKHGYGAGCCGDEHLTLLHGVARHDGGIQQKEMGIWSSYGYRWGQGMHHASGAMHVPADQRTAAWMRKNQDISHEPLVPADMTRWWGKISDAVPEEEKAEWLTKAVWGKP